MSKLFNINSSSFDSYIKSPINYIGNKYKLISQIIPLFPKNINTFIDLFGGSGTVLINTKANNYIYNDINNYVAEIFSGIISSDSADIINKINEIVKEYGLSMTNKEGFEKLRSDYNNGRKDWITLYTLMCHSFNHQFRFNNSHEYNSPFGANRSYFSDKQKQDLISLKRRMKSDTISVSSCRFQDFVLDMKADDLLYCDPPYYGSIGNYNDGNRGFENWTAECEITLLKLLDNVNQNGNKFALSNNLKYDNLYLNEWIYNHEYTVHYLNGNYVNCNYHKLDRSKDIEVLITNY